MRYPRKVDENQADIVNALRQIGCSVLSIASIGKGCPDLLVHSSHGTATVAGRMYLFEIKNPDNKSNSGKLNAAEREWIKAWGGPVHVIRSAEEAINVVTA